MPRQKAGQKKTEKNVIFEEHCEIRIIERGKRHSIRINLPPDEAHKSWHWSPRRQVEGTLNEARAAGIAYEEELRAHRRGDDQTLAEYVEVFREARRRNPAKQLDEQTFARESVDIDRILRYLGDTALLELTPKMIDEAYARMQADGASANTMHMVSMKLRQILTHACKNPDCRLRENPTDFSLSFPAPKPSKEKREQRHLSKQQAMDLIRTVRDGEKTGKTVALWISLATGLRRGEALALTWDDIDFEAGRLHVRHQYGKQRELKEPKTYNSRRTIAVDGTTLAFLSEWRGIQEAEFADAGRVPCGSTPVCTNELLDFIQPDNFSRWRRKYFIDLGLGRYTKEERWVDSRGIERVRLSGYEGPDFRALRKAHATLLVAGGVDPKTVQDRLGHEKISTTMEIYAEAEEENDVRAAAYIGSLIGGE